MTQLTLPHEIEQPATYPSWVTDVWRTLSKRQDILLRDRALPEFFHLSAHAGLHADVVPRFTQIDEHLYKATGWRLAAVNGLLPADVFFQYLAHRAFPVTWWMRDPANLEYLVEPDLFHDAYGHVPWLFDPRMATFLQAFGEAGIKVSTWGEKPLMRLLRVLWFTVEFGLIQTPQGRRIYGAGILSSSGESQAACDPESGALTRPFVLEDVMRQAYVIDTYQPLYFTLESLDELLAITAADLVACAALDVPDVPVPDLSVKGAPPTQGTASPLYAATQSSS